MGKKIGTAAVPAIPKGSMESINFLGGPARVASDRYEYEKDCISFAYDGVLALLGNVTKR